MQESSVFTPVQRAFQRLHVAWRERTIFSLQDFFVPRDFLLELMPPHSICAEIGVNYGHFSNMTLEIVKPKKLHLIDPWQYETDSAYSRALYGGIWGRNQAFMDRRHQYVLGRFEKRIASGQVEIHRSYSQDVYTDFADEYFDWIYVDGNHDYEFVKRDLNLYYSKVKSGGFIAGDDYDGIYKGWWQGGVKRAVDEFVDSDGVDVVEMKSRQFILRKK